MRRLNCYIAFKNKYNECNFLLREHDLVFCWDPQPGHPSLGKKGSSSSIIVFGAYGEGYGKEHNGKGHALFDISDELWAAICFHRLGGKTE